MAEIAPRLLVSLPQTGPLREAIARRLPGVPTVYITTDSEGPWPGVEAMLIGSPAREFPRLEPRLVPDLKFIQRVYTGLDAFPFARIARGVAVAGNVGAFAPFVAEQAVTLLLALANNLLPNYERVRAGQIRPVDAPRWLVGHTALLLGFGEIAHELAGKLRAFGMRIEAVSRTGVEDPRADRMYAAAQLLEALASADVVVDCRPLTSATRATINAAALAAMKPNAILVNVGRAGTVDEDAIFEHLRAHPEFRYGTDVLWREDPVRGTVEHRRPFATLPNFLASPHIAGLGPEPRARALDLALTNLARYFAGEPVRHVVDRQEYE
jgi:phosphoglycerate dehydrogenase-like enzyme